jgi:hypothetical protein
MLHDAEDGEIVVILPQFVVFEVIYVLQSLYGVTGERLAAMIRDLSFPGRRATRTPSMRRMMHFRRAILSDLLAPLLARRSAPC